MTTLQENSEKGTPFTGEEERLLSRLENALKDEAVEAFEAKLDATFPRENRFRQNLVKLAAVFVALVSLSDGIHFLSNPAHKKLYGRYYKHFPAENTSGFVRGEYDTREEAILLYSAGKYEQAIPKLQEAVSQQPTDAEAKFLLAIAMIETGQTDEPIKLLKEVIEAPENYYTDDALWYSALLCLKKPDYPASRELLLRIGSSSGYYASAQELLKKLGK